MMFGTGESGLLRFKILTGDTAACHQEYGYMRNFDMSVYSNTRSASAHTLEQANNNYSCFQVMLDLASIRCGLHATYVATRAKPLLNKLELELSLIEASSF